ncbi:MAG TPA: rRNA adenine N(6)-methyltransferase family protein [Streptosporangiaceae bacterium]|nr:rRNA adenine N(6)-methyltransferase family protein [Streptosporangiaceae bacterium]
MAGRRLAPNPAGAHFLRDRGLITQLARVSGASTGALVFDLGAGSGAITAGLAATGARVIAVERDPKLAARLRRRFSDEPNVRVVETDLRTIPFPRREFLVVASPPFSVTTVLCRRLLGEPAVPLGGAELIVQRGAARWLAAQRPRDAETAWWSARFQIRIARMINSASFVPAPRVDAAWLSVRPRAVPVSERGQRYLRATLESAYRRPSTRTEAALACGRRLLLRAGLDPVAPVAEVTADQWHRLAVLLGGGPIGL